jgi:hypothetical protein
VRYEIEVTPVGTDHVQADPELKIAYRVVPERVPEETAHAAACAAGIEVKTGARKAAERKTRSHLFMG